MREYSKNRARYRKRDIEPIKAMKATTITGTDLFLMYLADAAIIIAAIVAVSPSVSEFQIALALGFFAWFALVMVGGIFFGGITPGMLIMNIRFASMETKRIFILLDYIGFFFESFGTRFKFNNTYEIFKMWGDPYFQTPAMKECGVLLVNRKEFKKFLQDYTVNGKITWNDPEGPEQPIFRDYDKYETLP